MSDTRLAMRINALCELLFHQIDAAGGEMLSDDVKLISRYLHQLMDEYIQSCEDKSVLH